MLSYVSHGRSNNKMAKDKCLQIMYYLTPKNWSLLNARGCLKDKNACKMGNTPIIINHAIQ